jgi:predicted acylesterase/phospholipase RssA
MENKRIRRIGLTLAGGGAKGAYQIGAIKALIEEGYRFDAVAGTSIGAFNAILVFLGSIEKARNVWLSLKKWNLISFSKTIFMLPLLWAIYLIEDSTDKMFVDDNTRQFHVTIRILLIIILISFLIFFMFINLSSILSKGLFYTILLLTSFWLIIELIGEALRNSINVAISKLSKFKQILDTNIDCRNLQNVIPEIYVTIAKKKFTIDYGMTYIAEYYKINDMHYQDMLNYTLASMALPFRLIKYFEINKIRYVDGGIEDNTPIYPLLVCGCDDIFVIHCKPNPMEGKTKLLNNSELRQRILQLDHKRELDYQVSMENYFTHLEELRFKESINDYDAIFGILDSKEYLHNTYWRRLYFQRQMPMVMIK